MKIKIICVEGVWWMDENIKTTNDWYKKMINIMTGWIMNR